MADEEGKELTFPTLIRKEWYQERWFYSVVDIVGYLTGSENPKRYWSDLKRRVSNEGYAEVYAKCVQLKMLSSDGKQRLTDVADRETIFRIIQSIPSDTQKIEDFKLWLAQSGEQRLQTMEATQIDIEAERQKYRLEGRPEEWIEKRIQSILVRNELTQEWDERGAYKKDYGVLTNTIAKVRCDHNHFPGGGKMVADQFTGVSKLMEIARGAKRPGQDYLLVGAKQRKP